MSFNTLWDAKGKLRMTANLLAEKIMLRDGTDRDTSKVSAWAEMVIEALKEYYKSNPVDSKTSRWWW